MTTIEWPPAFTLRQSNRARHMRLQICQRRGLELIVPTHVNTQEAHTFLEKNRPWIERHWLRIQQLPKTEDKEIFPDEIRLNSVNEVWKIQTEYLDINRVVLNSFKQTKEIILRGNTQNIKTVKLILLKWLNQKAGEILLPWLQKLSKETQLFYTHASVRHTTTRWGSCSAKKSISLCCNLLFLPPNLVEYVLLHELCHTVHFNHSKSFWKLLQKLNPNCHQLRKQLKETKAFLPQWIS